MELIDLYVKEVGRRLPNKTHEDIEKEIRSMIMDAVEDQSAAEGKPADNTMIEGVLERLGPPEKMAASYLPPRYLIGPQLYPHFMTTLKIVLTVVLVLGAVGLGLSWGWKSAVPGDVLQAIGDAATGLLSSFWTVIGIVTFIFAIIQRFAPDFNSDKKTWKAAELYAVQDEEQVKVGELVAEAVISLVMIVFLNTYPGILGAFANVEGAILPEMTAAFKGFLPWISALFALQAGFNFLMVSQGRWQAGTRLGSIGLSAASIVLSLAMLLGPALLQVSAATQASLQSQGVTFGTLGSLNDVINMALRIALTVGVIFELIEVGKQLYKLFKVRIPELNV